MNLYHSETFFGTFFLHPFWIPFLGEIEIEIPFHFHGNYYLYVRKRKWKPLVHSTNNNSTATRCWSDTFFTMLHTWLIRVLKLMYVLVLVTKSAATQPTCASTLEKIPINYHFLILKCYFSPVLDPTSYLKMLFLAVRKHQISHWLPRVATLLAKERLRTATNTATHIFFLQSKHTLCFQFTFTPCNCSSQLLRHRWVTLAFSFNKLESPSFMFYTNFLYPYHTLYSIV